MKLLVILKVLALWSLLFTSLFAQSRIDVDNADVALGESVTLSFVLSDVLPSEAYTSISADFEYDNTRLELVAVDSEDSFMQNLGSVVATNPAQSGNNGRLRFGYFGAVSVTETGLLIKATFRTLRAGESRVRATRINMGGNLLDLERVFGGTIRAYTQPNPANILVPLANTSYLIQDNPEEQVRVFWNPVTDPDGDEIRYRLEMSASPFFLQPLITYDAGISDRGHFTLQQLEELLVPFYGETFENQPFYIRLVTIDAEGEQFSPSRSLIASRELVNTSISEQTPTAFVLAQNYPNPFNPTTSIGYEINTAAQVRLAVYDLTGREMAVLVDRNQVSGRYNVQFDAANLPSGVYIYRLTAGSFVQMRKMTLVR